MLKNFGTLVSYHSLSSWTHSKRTSLSLSLWSAARMSDDKNSDGGLDLDEVLAFAIDVAQKVS